MCLCAVHASQSPAAESVSGRDATVTAREVAFCRGHGGPGKVGGGVKMHEYSTNALSKNIC